ncbi:MAG: glycosyltransferase family 9 protein [Bacteroidia bacterium]
MKILLIRFSSIGDIVMTSPIIRCVRNQYSNTEVHFATKKQFEGILKHNPNIDKLHLLGDNWQEFIEQFGSYDLVFDMHKNLRTRRLINSIKAKKVYTYNKRNIDKWLLVNLKLNRLNGYSVVDNYFDFFPIKNDGYGLDYYLNPNADRTELNVQLPDKYVAIALGGRFKTKQLNFNRLRELIGSIELPVVLLGGKTERTLAGGVTSAKAHGQIINLVDKISLEESAFVVSKAHKVISHDTGLMHITAAFGKNMAVLWGNTVKELGFAPYYKKNTVADVRHFERNDLKCRPCSKLGYEKCPKVHHECMHYDFQEIGEWANL